ncbi:MAG: response regulator [Actinomycetota bacterium]|nr:response regulator [Actinomycetota bacterium]MDP2288520.1 response regulator [Actinomycetota bacterium]
MSELAIRVLVAEDEALIRMDLVEMLGELGYAVVGQVANGQLAVDLAAQLRPDVVLMDVAMPVRDGLSAATQIIQERIAPVVMVTAFSESDTVQHAAHAGALGYLVKPFNRSDLRPAIELAVARWAQMLQLEQQVDDLGARVRARDAVDEAKGQLQAQLGLTEAEAFAWLRKQAMDGRVTLAEVAAQVLRASPASNDRH